MKAFWLLASASAISTAGNSFLLLAIPLAVLRATGSPSLAVMGLATQSVPYLVGPLLGPLLDRYSRRFLFCCAELTQAALVCAIPVLLAQGEIGGVFAVMFVMGLAHVMSNVATDYGLIPAIVPPHRLDEATSWYNSLLMTARFLGPAIAGLVIAAVGTSWGLVIDGLSFLPTAVAAVVMPRSVPETDRTPLRRMLGEGVAYFRSRPDLRRLTLVLAVYNLGAGAIEPALLTVGQKHWHWSAAALGIAVSCGAMAAALGAWISLRAMRGTDRHRQVAVWFGVTMVGSLALLAGSPPVVLAGFVLVGLGGGAISSTTMAYRQHEIPSRLSGRVNTIIRTFIAGAIPASALFTGAAASLSSPFLTFFPVPVFAVLAWWLWRTRQSLTELPAKGQVSIRLQS